MALAGLEPAIAASERSQTQAIECAATRISMLCNYLD